jgi:hypothetical protein
LVAELGNQRISIFVAEAATKDNQMFTLLATIGPRELFGCKLMVLGVAICAESGSIALSSAEQQSVWVQHRIHGDTEKEVEESEGVNRRGSAQVLRGGAGLASSKRRT